MEVEREVESGQGSGKVQYVRGKDMPTVYSVYTFMFVQKFICWLQIRTKRSSKKVKCTLLS